jgi:hypothetical protein
MNAMLIAVFALFLGFQSAADIDRLQRELEQAASDIGRLQTSANTTARLQSDVEYLRDEVIYLKVRLRREGRVPATEFEEVQLQVRALRARIRGEGGRPASEGRTPPAGRNTSDIPVGQEIDVRLQTQISSSTAQIEDRFEATTVVDLYRGNDVLIPAGSVMRGIIRSVDRASRTDRKGELTVSFDQVTVNGRNYPMRGTVTQAIESEGVKGETKRIGTGSAIGGIIGGILGGVKGALMGILIGGGGTIAATPGKDVTLDPGTILRVRLDSPPDIR